MQHYSIKLLSFTPTSPRHPETHPQSMEHERERSFIPAYLAWHLLLALLTELWVTEAECSGESQGALIDAMALQQAEGRIVPTFICVKCFVNFFVSRFSLYLSSSLLFFSVFPQTQGELVMYSIPVTPWHCRFPQSQLGVNRSLSSWGGLAHWLWKPGHMVAVCWDVSDRECHGWGSWPLRGL